MLVLVTGGARSGKSSFAELYSSRLGELGAYIATAQAYDEEMRARIRLHRQQRKNEGFAWVTIEESYVLAETLQELYDSGSCAKDVLDGSGNGSRKRSVAGAAQQTAQHADRSGDSHRFFNDNPVILVDCLTLWLSNWLLQQEQYADVEERLQSLINDLHGVCRQYAGEEAKHLVLVTNEVGYGLVPEYKLGRQFRDLSGRMNQQLAREADQVFLVTAGIPVELKSIRYEL